MDIHDKSSIILSIFRRKGGEGIHTKIINSENGEKYRSALLVLEPLEKGLIIYSKDEKNWVLLTNIRVIQSDPFGLSSISYDQIKSIDFALQEEFKNHISNKSMFTKLKIIDKKDKVTILSIEEGKPFYGFFQVLQFVVQ